MGWGVIESDGYRDRLIQYGALETYPRDTFPTRLGSLYTGVKGLLNTFKPDEIAFEELFFSKNITTGMAVSMARGVYVHYIVEHVTELLVLRISLHLLWILVVTIP